MKGIFREEADSVNGFVNHRVGVPEGLGGGKTNGGLVRLVGRGFRASVK